jgi:hypothetical protein
MKRHIGKLANTDQRCLVVFMQIPGREDHALIVSTDNLNGRFEQALMSIVESKEAQAAVDLGVVMQRRIMQDTNENLLQALHDRGMLRAVHIDQVVMMPVPNMPFPLRGVLRDMGRTIPGEAPVKEAVERFNPHANNTAALSDENRLNIAQNLLVEANMLTAEANSKREKAYAYAPHLKPKDTVAVADYGLEMHEAPKARKPRAKVSAEEIVPVEVKPRRRVAKKAD